MLIKCPECELQVSDKALSCPHCGYPLKGEDKIKRTRTKNKRKKLPNGFGQITELKNKRLRKPFRAMVTVGKTEKGKPIVKMLKPEAFFETYNEAYEALIEYNKCPYDLDNDISVRELYDKWSKEYFEKISDTYSRTVKSVWSYCEPIKDMRVKDIRARHLKGCMDDGYRIEFRGKNKGEKVYPSAGTKARMKSVFNLMLDYAVEYEIVDKNYARTFEVSDGLLGEVEKNRIPHIIFTTEEINTLWKNIDKVKFVDWIIIQMYMGWRPQEIATLKLSDIDLDNWTITGGMKTDAGKQRTIPIPSKIKKFVKNNYDFAISIESEYLLNDKGHPNARWKITYDKYAARFNKVMDTLNLNPEHRPHDPRKTFVTRAKKSGVDEYAIKAIIGHRQSDITESAYTERDVEWLRQDIEKIEMV